MSIIGDAYEILKDIRELAERHKDKEISDKLVQLQGMFYDLKNENESLKSKIKALEETNELEKDLELTNKGWYIRKSERNEGKDVRYCAACFQNLHKLYPFTPGSMRRDMFCSNCKMRINR